MNTKITATITAVMTAAAAFTAAMPVSFAAGAEYEEIILSVKNRLNIPESYTEFENSGQYESNGKTVYSFSWSTEDDKKSIQVNCSSDGFISYYSSNDRDSERDSYDALSMDDAKAEETARDFLVQADPELRDIISLERSTYSYGGISYNINAEFYGIEYYRYVGSITVDKNYSVLDMNIELPEITDPGSAEYIDQEEAAELYKNKIGIRTDYLTYFEDDTLYAFPAYRSIDDKAIDAVTGEVLDVGGEYRVAYGAAEQATADANSGGGSGAYKELSESEMRETAVLNGLISAEDAVALIKERTGLDFEPEYTSLQVNSGRRYAYYFSAENTSVEMDAHNGDIISINTVIDPEEKDTTKLAGYGFGDSASAKMLIEMLAPENGSVFEYDEESSAEATDQNDTVEAEGSVFDYKVNGVKVEGASARIYKSNDNGRIRYSAYIPSTEIYKTAEYASPDTFADVDELIYSDPLFAELKYIDTPDGVKAAYIADSFMKNAVTGADVDYRNEETGDDTIEYTDVAGHWVEETAEKLAASGIGFKGGALEPDTHVTAGDVKEIMSEVFGSRTNEYIEKDDSVEITRLEAAEMIIKCEGLETVAAMDIYAQPYIDITSNYGVTAILKGYGVIDGSVDTFRPDDALTRAEFLQLVYNTLANVK